MSDPVRIGQIWEIWSEERWRTAKVQGVWHDQIEVIYDGPTDTPDSKGIDVLDRRAMLTDKAKYRLITSA